MNTMPKYVVSTMLTTASAWRNSTLIRSNVVEEVRTLKAQPGKNIVIDGSSVLVHTLAEHDLIDEYSLFVYPVVLGSGKKLFPEGLRRSSAPDRSQATAIRRCAHALRTRMMGLSLLQKFAFG